MENEVVNEKDEENMEEEEKKEEEDDVDGEDKTNKTVGRMQAAPLQTSTPTTVDTVPLFLAPEVSVSGQYQYGKMTGIETPPVDLTKTECGGIGSRTY